MIDITFAVDVGCQVSGLSPSCDFNVDVTVDKSAIEAQLKKMISMTSLKKYGNPNFGKSSFFSHLSFFSFLFFSCLEIGILWIDPMGNLSSFPRFGSNVAIRFHHL